MKPCLTEPLSTFLLQDAVLADLINRLYPKWIVTYLEHDSLLQNIESEELTEAECRAAWAAYEAEKEAASNPAAGKHDKCDIYCRVVYNCPRQVLERKPQTLEPSETAEKYE